jgi:hypothetical protein
MLTKAENRASNSENLNLSNFEKVESVVLKIITSMSNWMALTSHDTS